MPAENEIFFSYAWGDENETGENREKIVNDLYESLKADGYNVVRDKNDLGYRGYISDFMARIGEGKNIVVVISQKYVKSPYCMFELYEIARNCNLNKYRFKERVLPIMIERIDFSRPDIFREYLSYWESEFNQYKSLAQERPGELELQKEFNKIKKIHENYSDLVLWLKDMNTLCPELLSADNFSEIKKAIQESIPIPGKKMNQKSLIREKKHPYSH